MKSTPLIVGIFLLICTVASENLMCYNCFAFRDHYSSDPSCWMEPNPTTLTNCTATVVPGSPYSSVDIRYFISNNCSGFHQFHGLLYESIFDLRSGSHGKNGSIIVGSTIPGKLGCLTYTGTFNDEFFVIRGCRLVRDSINTDDCTNLTSAVLDGIKSNLTEACFCSNDNCNGPHKDYYSQAASNQPMKPTTTTISVPFVTTESMQRNGTSGRRITSYSLFVTAIAYFWSSYIHSHE